MEEPINNLQAIKLLILEKSKIEKKTLVLLQSLNSGPIIQINLEKEGRVINILSLVIDSNHS